MSGDLRRRLDFPDPLEQAQALADLSRDLRQLIPRNGKLTPKNSGRMGEERLLWDCLASEYPIVVDGACTAVLSLASANLLDVDLARLKLLEALTKTRNLSSIVAALAEVGDKVEEQWKSLTRGMNASPASIPHVLAWIRNQMQKDASDERIVPLLVQMLEESRLNFFFEFLSLSSEFPLIQDLIYRLTLLNPGLFVQSSLLTMGFSRWKRDGTEEGCLVRMWEGRGEWSQGWSLPTQPSPVLGFQLSSSISGAIPNQLNQLLELAEKYLASHPSPFGRASLLSGLLFALGHVKIRGTADADSQKALALLKNCLGLVENSLMSNKYFGVSEKISKIQRSQSSLAVEFVKLFHEVESLDINLGQSSTFQPTKLSVDTGILALLSAETPASHAFWLSFLVKCATLKPPLVGHIFPVILHRYAKESRADFKERYLDTIPRLASHRFPTQKLLQFLQALTAKPGLLSKALELLLELFRRQEKIFPQIRDILVKNLDSKDPEIAARKLEFIHTVCLQSGEEFGEDLVPVLSNVINTEKSSEGGLLVALAVSAITELSSQEVMDIESVWSLLGPKLASDGRAEVKVELCRLLRHSADPDLEISEEFRLKSFALLWQFSQDKDGKVQVAAIKSISKFDGTYLLQSLLPDLEEPNTGTEEKQEDEDEKVSGDQLIAILKNLTPSKDMEKEFSIFLNRLVREEIASYGRGMFRPNSIRKTPTPRTDPLLMPLSKLFSDDPNTWSSSTALLALYSFEPKESFGKQGVYKHEKSYSAIFKVLLSKVSPIAGSQAGLIDVLLGWKLFLGRFYAVLIEVHETAQEGAGDASAAWLWARDRIGQMITQAFIENINSSENATWCLAALILLTLKNEKEGEGYQPAVQSQYLSPDQWTVMAMEALAQGIIPSYTLRARPLFPQQTRRVTERQGSYALLGLAYTLPPAEAKIRPFLGTALGEEFCKALLGEKLSGKGHEERKFAVAVALGILAYKSPEESHIDKIHDHLATQFTSLKDQGIVGSPGNSEGRITMGLVLAASAPGSSQRVPRMKSAASRIESVQPFVKATMRLEQSKHGEEIEPFEDTVSELLAAVTEHKDEESLLRLSCRFVPMDLMSLSLSITPFERNPKNEQSYRNMLHSFLKEKNPTVNLPAAKLIIATKAQPRVIDNSLPPDYSYLPRQSLLRASINAIKTEGANRFVVETILAGILLGFEARDLPPLDWERLLNPELHTHVKTVEGIFLGVKVKNLQLLHRFTSPQRLASLTLESPMKILQRLPNEIEGWDGPVLESVLDRVMHILPRETRPTIWETIEKILGCEKLNSVITEAVTSFFWGYLESVELEDSSASTSLLAGMEKPLRLLGEEERSSKKQVFFTKSPLKALWLQCYESKTLPGGKDLAETLGLLQGASRFSGLCLIFGRLQQSSSGWKEAEVGWVGEVVAQSLCQLGAPETDPKSRKEQSENEELEIQTSLFSLALCAYSEFQLPFFLPAEAPAGWEEKMMDYIYSCTPHLTSDLAQYSSWSKHMSKETPKMSNNITTVRRSIKNVAYNFSDAQVKVREATSNDPWGPSSSLMSDIADLTHNPLSFTDCMQMIWKRLNDHGKNWRHVYKSLVLLDYLVKTGSEKVAQQCKENIYAIQTLKDFQHMEETKDQGLNVREKAKQLVLLLKDDERLKTERIKALAAKKRFSQTSMGISSDGSTHNLGRSDRPSDSDNTPDAKERKRTDSELIEARPMSSEEEEMHLQIALALSSEEAEKEVEKRRSEKAKLHSTLSESKLKTGNQDSNITLSQPPRPQSALDELLTLQPPPSLPRPQHRVPTNDFGDNRGDPFASPEDPSAMSGSACPPPLTNPFQDSPYSLPMSDPWNMQPAFNPSVPKDPFSPDGMTSSVSGNNPFGSPPPVHALPTPPPSFVCGGPGDTWNFDSMNSSLGSDVSAGTGGNQSRTPQAFLGTNSSLVNLDNLLGPTIHSAGQSTNNPFVQDMMAPPMQSRSTNPFLAQQRPPSLNQMKAQTT